jgi:hypothetical protein
MSLLARNAYNEVLDGEGDYDEDHGGDLCFDCAIPAEVGSNIDLGRAIMMGERRRRLRRKPRRELPVTA